MKERRYFPAKLAGEHVILDLRTMTVARASTTNSTLWRACDCLDAGDTQLAERLI